MKSRTNESNNGANDEIITEFGAPDDSLMAMYKDCTDNYGCGEGEWGNNLLSNKLLVYGDGMISKENGTSAPTHRVSSAELQLSKKIAQQLVAQCPDEIGMGSESGDNFKPFYMVAQLGADANDTVEAPTAITEDLIRHKFAGTIFPHTDIKIEPLEPQGSWWEAVRTDGEEEEDPEKYFAPWHHMIAAFQEHPQLRAPVFVQIGTYEHMQNLDEKAFPAGTEMTGSVYPRMAVALTAAGSIVGAFSHVVCT